jgi:hypothetical protein
MDFYGDFDKMSLADLKAAYDFVREDAKDLEEAAGKNGVKPEKIPAYPEVKKVENALYHVLLNRTRDLLTKLPKPAL